MQGNKSESEAGQRGVGIGQVQGGAAPMVAREGRTRSEDWGHRAAEAQRMRLVWIGSREWHT
jgi:hypothetical protein